MGQKLVIGPIDKGLRTDRLPFNIDNDSFPTLINAYQWRGRIKRKRGTEFLGRLTRYFNSTLSAFGTPATQPLVGGALNIFTAFGLQSTGNIVPGTVTITNVTVAQVYTDDGFGVLVGSLGGSGTIVYSTGDITIVGGGTNSINVSFFYYPGLPVMGIEDLVIESSAFPGTLGFDTIYSYNVQPIAPYNIYDVSFYKNSASITAYPGYTPKPAQSPTPTSWNGDFYQQFWTVNYQGALWATNGVNTPFEPNNIGMQFAPASTITVVSNTATTLVVTITNCPLIIGDFVFLNEFGSSSAANSQTINFQSGYVTACSPNTPPLATKTLTITLPNASLATDTYTPGIIQYLTNRSDVTKDCLRWYDGDPTDGTNSDPTTFVASRGWVNFMPPLSQGAYVISDEDEGIYYLVGSRMIVPFKDRLLFLGAVIQTSTGPPIYLQDTVVYSMNGVPYYTASFQGSPVSDQTQFFPILTPGYTSQSPQYTAIAASFFEDQFGFGGFEPAGVDQPLITAAFNEDTLITGFKNFQARLVSTGNDITPFEFFSINTEYGSSSTFSIVTMDQGVITRGDKGYVMTSQTNCQRIDLDILDQVFEINATNNGTEQFCTTRDFINEWVYFTYKGEDSETTHYPNQTLQFNYRDNSWAIFNESYTTYGSFRYQTGFTWSTVGTIYPTWKAWNDPWNAGISQLEQPLVVGGNQQGFLIVKGKGTEESTSLSITSFSTNVATSIDHGLNTDDFIVISDCIGDISSQVNGKIFSVNVLTSDTFSLNPSITSASYFGGGLITRIYNPFIQTKQFPLAWDTGRKTRIGVQQYLLSSTFDSEITLLIFLSQNSANAYNNGPVIPSPNSVNNSLIYSTILYTCPESTNLGLTPANVNLQMPTAFQQQQIWHRINTSLIGDTVQLGFTMSESQIRDVEENGTPKNAFSEIEIHSIIMDVSPSSMLA